MMRDVVLGERSDQAVHPACEAVRVERPEARASRVRRVEMADRPCGFSEVVERLAEREMQRYPLRVAKPGVLRQCRDPVQQWLVSRRDPVGR